VISQKNVAKSRSSVRGCGKRVVGRWMLRQKSSEASFVFSRKETLVAAPLFPLSWPPPPFSPHLAVPPLPLCWSPPLLQWKPPSTSPPLPPPSRSPPTQQGSRRGGARWIEEEDRTKEMFYSHLFLQIFLGKP
jgi:hypothetical protein